MAKTMLRDDLLRSHAFSAPRPQRVERIETHISRVFQGKRDVYKVKKPVDLGFLDFTTIEKRKQACHAEVALNERLAPGRLPRRRARRSPWGRRVRIRRDRRRGGLGCPHATPA
jgi:hypothetical protein